MKKIILGLVCFVMTFALTAPVTSAIATTAQTPNAASLTDESKILSQTLGLLATVLNDATKQAKNDPAKAAAIKTRLGAIVAQLSKISVTLAALNSPANTLAVKNENISAPIVVAVSQTELNAEKNSEPLPATVSDKSSAPLTETLGMPEPRTNHIADIFAKSKQLAWPTLGIIAAALATLYFRRRDGKERNAKQFRREHQQKVRIVAPVTPPSIPLVEAINQSPGDYEYEY